MVTRLVYCYDPFGVLLNQPGSLTQPYGFSTKRYNALVGMVQYQYRNYFPEIGRWDRRDPLGEADGLNLYAFVGNNPVNWVDTWGLYRSPEWMRRYIPGQIYWDAALTALEHGDYAGAAGNTLNMVALQALLVASLGQSSAVQQAISCGIETVGTGVGIAEAAETGVKLTGKAQKIIGGLRNLKDIRAGDAILLRGGKGKLVKEIGYLADKTVGEIANMAATGDDFAITAIKIIKEAARISGKSGLR